MVSKTHSIADLNEGDRILVTAAASAADIEATFEFVRYAMDLANSHEALRALE